ncbi:MAG: aromatic ring-hydroxylating dioxygenase subunit alpha [Betaproteobacteria bacterium]|nr:aromatic ring-hydroxylating dioxygenase subunit alpha [Betaproteobacteria bacterium]
MTVAEKIHPDRIRAKVQSGLHNVWHPVLPSWRVHGAPVGITRLGENISLWRDKEGVVRAIEDRCPHRGARLSFGWNLGDRIACWYHGIELDGSGTVKNVPAVHGCPLEGTKCVRSYPVKELQGAIFLYFGDELHPEPCAFEPPEQLASPEWGAMLCTSYWNCNWQYAVDNVMDPMHGAYLHALSHSMAMGDKQAEMHIRTTDTGIVFEKTGQRGVNFDWVEWGESGSCWLRLSIPYQKKFGPGGPFYIIGYATPIDDDHCEVFFWRCRQATGWQRDVWKFLYKNRLEGLHWDVLEQDRLLLENMAPGARDNEFLYQHDLGLSRVRRRLERKAAEQLGALDQARAEKARADQTRADQTSENAAGQPQAAD